MTNGSRTAKKKRSKGKPHVYKDYWRYEWTYRGTYCSDAAAFCDMMSEALNTIEATQ